MEKTMNTLCRIFDATHAEILAALVTGIATGAALALSI